MPISTTVVRRQCFEGGHSFGGGLGGRKRICSNLQATPTKFSRLVVDDTNPL